MHAWQLQFCALAPPEMDPAISTNEAMLVLNSMCEEQGASPPWLGYGGAVRAAATGCPPSGGLKPEAGIPFVFLFHHLAAYSSVEFVQRALEVLSESPQAMQKRIFGSGPSGYFRSPSLPSIVVLFLESHLHFQ